MQIKYLAIAAIAALSSLTSSLHGAGLFTVQTDGNGDFISTSLGTATWSGNGTVTPNITGTESGLTIVSGTSGGTFEPGNFAKNAGVPAPYLNGDINNSGIGLSISVSVTGTNASFDFGALNRNTGSNGPNYWQNFSITNMQNVESLTVSYIFSEPVAAMRGTNDTFSNAPYLVAMRQASGAGTYDATAIIDNLTIDGDFFDIANHPDVNFMTLGNATWNNSTGEGSIIGQGTSAIFNGLLRLDLDGDGVVTGPTTSTINDGIVQEIERTYATGMTWTITSNDTTFSSGSEFYFSFNGVQFPDTIPEPSALFLSMLGIAGVTFHRRRRPN